MSAKQTKRPMRAKQAKRPMRAKQTKAPTSAKQAKRPMRAKQAKNPTSAKQAKRPMRGLVTITLSVNGRRHRASVPPMKRLLDVLREDLALTGTKEGCGEGECGACTVVLDGRTVNSCLVPAIHADGARVTTVEGLAKGRSLSVLQRAFVELGGSQCGICTPGMLVSAASLLESMPGRVPTDAQVRDALAGNLCRCTGYQKIVDAVRAAAGPARRAQPQRAKPKPAKPKRAAKRASASAKPATRRMAPKSRAAAKKRTARRGGSR